jgi:hypothetical protein
MLLRKITEVVQSVSGPGAALNARHEVDRAVSSRNDVEAQLQRVRRHPASKPEAA